MLPEPETTSFTAASIDELEAALGSPSTGFEQTLIQDAGMYTVALLPISNAGTIEKGATGTLVSFQGCHYILTAAHVAEKLKDRDTAKIGVTLKAEIDHRYLIHKNYIQWLGPAKPEKWNQWGPDIALLRIPAIDAKHIEEAGRGAFLNLSKSRTLPLGDVKYPQCRVLMGVPAALADYTDPLHADLCLDGTVMPPGNETPHERAAFDYIDLELSFHPLHAKASLHGISGGGLWRFLFYKNAATGKFESFRVLEGVAFFGLGPTVRCHGPKSIGNALRALFDGVEILG